MSRWPLAMRGTWRDEHGSIVLLLLIACLAAAMVIQTASITLLIAEKAVADEREGRQRLQEKDDILAALVPRAATSWQPAGWLPIGTGEGAIDEIPGGEEWVLGAHARQAPTLSEGQTSAWLERGRDGIDLPAAGLVAGEVSAAVGRVVPWVEREARAAGEGPAADQAPAMSETDEGVPDGGGVGEAGVVCFVGSEPSEMVVGEGVCVEKLAASWRLDPGWADIAEVLERGGCALAGSQGVIALTAKPGQTQTVQFAAAGAGDSAARPALVILTGGGTLDLRGLGDVFAVVVVDDGSVLLEGTAVHGAVFATRTVSLGNSGRVLWARDILRWATDRSLQRVRLVPGTRQESME